MHGCAWMAALPSNAIYFLKNSLIPGQNLHPCKRTSILWFSFMAIFSVLRWCL